MFDPATPVNVIFGLVLVNVGAGELVQNAVLSVVVNAYATVFSVVVVYLVVELDDPFLEWNIQYQL